MQIKLPSSPLPSNSMNTTSNTIIENITSDYSRMFGNEIIPKPNHITRVLYQNTGSFEISTDSHKFEAMREAMYDNEEDIGFLVKTSTHWQHKGNLPKIKQVMRQFWSRKCIQTTTTIIP